MKDSFQSVSRPGKSVGTRVCLACKKDVHIDGFYKDKSRADGLNDNCKSCVSLAHKAAYKKHKAKWGQWRGRTNEYDRKYNRQLRERVLAHYGRSCACCGESTYEFLSIDHTEGGGNKHRAEHLRHKGGNLQVRWLIKNNFPPGFRTLCHNCNNAIGWYKNCPHQLGKLVMPVTATRIAVTPHDVDLIKDQ